jgi:hypothetical protein
MLYLQSLKKGFLLLAVLITGMSVSRQAPFNEGVYPACGVSNANVNAGEEIVYKLYYNLNFVWVPAGEATFRVKDADDELVLSAKGITYPSYNWFFPVDDYFESIVNKKTMLPASHLRNIKEGKYTAYDKVFFDQQKKIAVCHRGKDKQSAQRSEHKLDGCMHDVVSIIYYLRNVNFEGFKNGETFPVKVFLDKETYPLTVKYHGKRSNLKVKDNGRMNTLLFSPQVIAGSVFKEGDEMKIYVSDDANRIPVLIESPISVGSVKAVLKSYNGLKYPFAAKVK